MNLSILDYIVVAVPLVVILFVSIYLQRYMRSVADFLAANRSAGRFLICTSMDAGGSNVMSLLVAMEVFSHVGFSLTFWAKLTEVFFFFLGILGLVSYRFRETRVLTFHQFFEVRYSKGLRVFASFLNVFSGVFNFGIQPAIVARFFVYFCGMPEVCHWGGIGIPTFLVVMLILMGASLFFALTGGQISVMVTDCLEGVISSVFYLIVGIFIVCTLTTAQMRGALLSGAPGASYVDPFDIGARPDFNGWYVFFVFFLSLYYFRGNAWSGGFAAAAKSAHELRMAQILGNWRALSYGQMGVLVSIAAFTVLHHPDFARQREIVAQGVQGISHPTLQNQMSLPMALGLLLAPGIKGAFCAILLFGVLASQGALLHGYGTTFLQDVVLPLRKEPFEAKSHIRWLRITIFGIALFACAFSYFFKPVEYLTMIVALIGAIYLGGIGLVVWGGLYWKKGTTTAAWTAMSIGGILGVAFNLVQELWAPLNHLLTAWFGSASSVGRFLTANPDHSPFNGQQLTAITAATAGMAYIVVSLATCREDFNMDAMLHRGKYRIPSEDILVESSGKKSWYARLLDIDEHFTPGDKALTVVTVVWTLFWKVVAVGIVVWTLVLGRLSARWWFNYSMITGVWLTLAIGCITTVWFLHGVTRDLMALVVALQKAKRNDADDGTVRGHHNTGENKLIEAGAKQPSLK
jgi:SSS family solute:Na+ symporter